MKRIVKFGLVSVLMVGVSNIANAIDYGNEIAYNSNAAQNRSNEDLSWLEGEWSYKMSIYGRTYESRVVIKDDLIEVVTNGELYYIGSFSIDGNILRYNRQNGSADIFYIDRTNKYLMVDERNRMERLRYFKSTQTKENNNVSKPVQSSNEDNKIYTGVDTPAKYPGGEVELVKWVGEAAKKNFPWLAFEEGIYNKRVIVRFVVEKDGSISNVEIVRGHQYFDKEAVRIVKSIPKKFIPAKHNGVVVRKWFTLPVSFKL